MVKGLEYFREHFANYSDKYVLIGGTACTLVMEDVGLDFRATKDLDIVLYAEALDAAFVTAFWQFVITGGYQNQQKSTGKEIFYRFSSPKNQKFPAMLELFSRTPQILQPKIGSRLTPIPVSDAVTSLSAILLNDDYYQFIQTGKQSLDNLPVVRASHLIPLKAKAWIDLMQQKDQGIPIDERNIRKHKNDILRLSQLLSPALHIVLPSSIKLDMIHFLRHMEEKELFDLKTLGIKGQTHSTLLLNLREIYT